MNKTYWVYILTNSHNTVFYVGVTHNLIQRIWQHKHKVVPGFTEHYNVMKLVYFESYDFVQEAIMREKRLKRWHRAWKFDLIQSMNPSWDDLYTRIISAGIPGHARDDKGNI